MKANMQRTSKKDRTYDKESVAYAVFLAVSFLVALCSISYAFAVGVISVY